ncbi:MAG: response regulator [Oligoflexia bacterium]|nr:response regulator [Oligoflexia bacterium]
MRILFVDDHQDLVEMYVAEIQCEIPEHEFFTATDGLEAIEVCKRNNITHIFSDAKMPKMNGIELAKTIQRDFPEVTFFMISGYPGNYTPEFLKSIGIKKFFEKPIDFDELIEFVKNLDNLKF